MENASANKFPMPTTMTCVGVIFAPTQPATIAKIVTTPSSPERESVGQVSAI